jgi:cytochrome c553
MPAPSRLAAILAFAWCLGPYAARADTAAAWAFLTPNQSEAAPDSLAHHVPDSTRTYTYKQVTDGLDPPDWFPDSHPPMPRVVAHSDGPTYACAYCHLASGPGHPESGNMTGLSADYIARQMADFKTGTRKEPFRMAAIAKATSEQDSKEAAIWFSQLPVRPWFFVVETDTVPKSYVTPVRARYAAPDGGTEPLGDRIVELPIDSKLFQNRDPNSGFYTYVPFGSVEAGARIVNAPVSATIGSCTSCHGADLMGQGNAPRLAGVSALYIARQLLDFQNGDRAGQDAEQMPEIAKTLDDAKILAVAAYLTSRPVKSSAP